MHIYKSHMQARRHVIKSGPAEVRASAKGTSGGEHERGDRGGGGGGGVSRLE